MILHAENPKKSIKRLLEIYKKAIRIRDCRTEINIKI